MSKQITIGTTITDGTNEATVSEIVNVDTTAKENTWGVKVNGETAKGKTFEVFVFDNGHKCPRCHINQMLNNGFTVK